MKYPHDVILGPVVSEKSFDLIEEYNTYSFLVDPRSNKTEIRQSVEAIFEVQVVSVNTYNRRGKMKRTRRTLGKRKDTKRALVTLAEGESIDLFGL
ncbi:MAG: 50S ribosomal protein L23 [Actinomycetia bacterium]|nr:50S ribosomal protein L23 [Actinomycetes bacterium]MCQ3804964.1 50S ribosomal protein L23 [Acidimicrobiia bacterium]MCY4651392.1 50S ribosomal protein L23 [bacterium]